MLADAAAWIGVRLASEPPRHVGWGLLLDGVVEHVENRSTDVLTHVRGRYLGRFLKRMHRVGTAHCSR